MKELKSKYPIAINPEKVGSYPALTKSGAGYFYDEVLEYRVWCHGVNDGVKAFATYEEAEKFSSKRKKAESPLVLVLQKEWVDEPEEGVLVHMKTERITEWLPEWLKEHKRTGEDTIPNFIRSRSN